MQRWIAIVAVLGLIIIGGRAFAQTTSLEQCNDPYATVACIYLPLLDQPLPTPTAIIPPTITPSPGPTARPTVGPTATPAPLPPSYSDCASDPNGSRAPNYPVRIVTINKSAETVTLRNVSTSTIDLSGWEMCSITGNQHHPIGGTLAPGQSRVFPGPAGNIWNNSQQDDGALYDPSGSLVSYYRD